MTTWTFTDGQLSPEPDAATTERQVRLVRVVLWSRALDCLARNLAMAGALVEAYRAGWQSCSVLCPEDGCVMTEADLIAAEEQSWEPNIEGVPWRTLP